uniref:Uncharacterized protein n=1 Tax=Rhizophora mucronata TaxID=61149 RepID=A0A2P2QW53_RHIMU
MVKVIKVDSPVELKSLMIGIINVMPVCGCLLAFYVSWHTHA